MTDDFRPRPRTFKETLTLARDLWAVILILGGLMGTLAAIVSAGLWTLQGERVVSFAREELGIDQLHDSIERLARETRILRETQPGYVREPVVQGGELVLVQWFQRTRGGAGCRLTDLTFLYTDDSGVVWAGENRKPSIQLSTEPTRRELITRVPDRVPPGTTGVNLQLLYDCAGVLKFEATAPVRFVLTAKGPSDAN